MIVLVSFYLENSFHQLFVAFEKKRSSKLEKSESKTFVYCLHNYFFVTTFSAFAQDAASTLRTTKKLIV